MEQNMEKQRKDLITWDGVNELIERWRLSLGQIPNRCERRYVRVPDDEYDPLIVPFTQGVVPADFDAIDECDDEGEVGWLKLKDCPLRVLFWRVHGMAFVDGFDLGKGDSIDGLLDGASLLAFRNEGELIDMIEDVGFQCYSMGDSEAGDHMTHIERHGKHVVSIESSDGRIAAVWAIVSAEQGVDVNSKEWTKLDSIYSRW